MRDQVGEVKMASNLGPIHYLLLLLSLLNIDTVTSAKYKQDQKVLVYNFIEIVYSLMLVSFVSLSLSLSLSLFIFILFRLFFM